MDNAKTKADQLHAAQLISAFVLATYIVQFPYFLDLKFGASSHLLWLHSPFGVGLVNFEYKIKDEDLQSCDIKVE